ncbi:MATE family efflux transporter [Leptospira sp. 96542]|nr:MATE family efflux transporter [Leptospira sp. 96542]
MKDKILTQILNLKVGLKELLPIALPIFISQAIDVVMVFSDRFFLAQLGKEELAATLSGGMILYVFSTLIVGMLGQITSLVGQYRGAGFMHKAIQTVHQGIFISIVIGFLFVFFSKEFAPLLLDFFGHELSLSTKELEYYSILSFSIVTVSIRTSLASFFVGVERTKIVTLAAFVAVVINLPLTYVLVFGEFGFPKLGIQGAALGTVVAGLFPIIILTIKFYSKEFRIKFKTNTIIKLKTDIMYKLLRYGLPSGIEMSANVSGFLFFTMVMYSYSGDVAAATTIVLNWDMVCFVPLLGIGQAVSGQVGKYLGEKNRQSALRSAYSALCFGWIYSICITITYFTLNYYLVKLFMPLGGVYSFQNVAVYAEAMLKISCLYFLFDSTYSILGGILKGSGDTIWPMFISNIMMWACAIFVYHLKNNYGFGPLISWWALTAMVLCLGILYFRRFLQKKWLDRLMIN